jgi:1-acyl-sn-glycerol-3-phosphate acyltransferase
MIARPDENGHGLPRIEMSTVRRSYQFMAPVLKRYFRSEVRGLERVPDGQTLLVANHDGGMLPIDTICFGIGWYEHFQFQRPLYVLTHDIMHGLWKSFSRLLSESGLIKADREHMDLALGAGYPVLVLPGAAREAFRPYSKRRDIDLGGRMGFVAQAIRWGVPITPVVTVGAHETVFVLSSGQKLAKRLGLHRIVRSADVMPVMAGLPWGLWALPFLPQLPLPAKITIEVLDPIWLPEVLGRPLSEEDASDAHTVHAGYRIVLARMRMAIDRLYDERRYPILG